MLPETLTPRTLILLGGLVLLVFPALFVMSGLLTMPLAQALTADLAGPLSAALSAALSMGVCFALLRHLSPGEGERSRSTSSEVSKD